MEIFLEILLVLINHFSGKELDWLLCNIKPINIKVE